MAQYATPQFIEEEGKIVYFLTYRQFFILVGGGAVIALLYWTVPWFVVFFLGSAVVLVTALGLAFLKINHQSLPMFFLTFLGFTIRAKTYTWHKKEVGYEAKIGKTPTKQIPATATIKPPMNMQPSKLRNIQKTIDTKA